MHRCVVWIAFLAILLSSLAPAISHAVAAAKGTANAWVEICTVAGDKRVRADSAPDAESPAPAEHATHFEHCAFCQTHAGAIGWLPAAFAMPVILGSHVLPSLFYQSSRPLFAWAVAQPRAPPALS